MKLFSITSSTTILSLFCSTCLAVRDPQATDIVDFIYNDGTSFIDLEIPLHASVDEDGRSIYEGSKTIPRANIYAAKIVNGPPRVMCEFNARPRNTNSEGEGGRAGELQLETVANIYIMLGLVQYTSPPQDVVEIKCLAYNCNLDEWNAIVASQCVATSARTVTVTRDL